MRESIIRRSEALGSKSLAFVLNKRNDSLIIEIRFNSMHVNRHLDLPGGRCALALRDMTVLTVLKFTFWSVRARLQATGLCQNHQWFGPISILLAATGAWFRCDDSEKQLFVWTTTMARDRWLIQSPG